ncbi:MAG: 50S ribosomal protein L37 [Thermoproteota archaeon]|nr:50S ribosomal protein L37 [Thermoproteota archaeon]
MVSRRRRSAAALKGLGVRYGATVRKRYGKAYSTLKQKRRCPKCASLQFHRIVIGIWHCPKCNYKVAGGAYSVEAQKLHS